MPDALLAHVVTFGRVLREAGLEVGPGRLADALRGLDAADLTEQEDVYWTLRQTLVSHRDDLALFDRAFAAWFLREAVAPGSRVEPGAVLIRSSPAGEVRAEEGDAAEQGERRLGASVQELLREKNFAEMTPEELERALRLVAEIAQVRPLRTSRRRAADPRGDRLDLRRPSVGPCAAAATRSSGRIARASSCRAGSSCSATCRARWTRTRARCSSFSMPCSAAGAGSRLSPSAHG